MKLVSIIMTCFNGEKYLKEAIKSIISQSYKNWELIFIDNNSTDQSRSIINSFKDKRIKYYYLKKTVNLGTVRNIGLSKCSGEFISFLDVDDIWLNNKLEMQVDKLNADNTIDVLYTNYSNLIEDTEEKIKKKMFNGYCQRNIILSYIKGKPLTAWLTLIIRKNSLLKLDHTFDKNLHITSDFDLIIRMSNFSNFEFLDEYLCKYRVHQKNESKNRKNEVIELFYIIQKYKSDINIKSILSTNYFSLKIFIKYILIKLKILK